MEFFLFCSAGPCGGMQCCAFPSLSVTRRGEPEEQAFRRTERKGETQERIKGKRGKHCGEGERRASNQGFWMKVRVLKNAWERNRFNYAASRRRVAPLGAAAAAWSVPSCPEWAAGEPNSQWRDEIKVQTDKRVSQSDGIFRQDAGSELPGSRVLGGGAGGEALQEEESVGGTRVKFGCRHRRRHEHLHRWDRRKLEPGFLEIFLLRLHPFILRTRWNNKTHGPQIYILQSNNFLISQSFVFTN